MCMSCGDTYVSVQVVPAKYGGTNGFLSCWLWHFLWVQWDNLSKRLVRATWYVHMSCRTWWCKCVSYRTGIQVCTRTLLAMLTSITALKYVFTSSSVMFLSKHCVLVWWSFLWPLLSGQSHPTASHGLRRHAHVDCLWSKSALYTYIWHSYAHSGSGSDCAIQMMMVSSTQL